MGRRRGRSRGILCGALLMLGGGDTLSPPLVDEEMEERFQLYWQTTFSLQFEIGWLIGS